MSTDLHPRIVSARAGRGRDGGTFRDGRPARRAAGFADRIRRRRRGGGAVGKRRGDGPGRDQAVVSSTVVVGPFCLTEAMPSSRAVSLEYSSLVPMTWWLAAVSTK